MQLSCITTYPNLEPLTAIQMQHHFSDALNAKEHLSSYLQQEVLYQNNLQQVLNELEQDTQVSAQKKPYIKDQMIGSLMRAYVLSKRTIVSHICSSNNPFVESLKALATTLANNQEVVLTCLLDEIVQDANNLPEKEIRVLAQQAINFNIDDLLKLYLRSNIDQYIEKTGLDYTQCNSLHQKIHEYVSLSIQQQQIKRILAALDEQNLFQAIQILLEKNHYDTKIDPCLLLFQYATNITIRPKQIEVINALLRQVDGNFDSVVEKVIMGGGKSKVILPILAYKKAMKSNLVIIEVPRALLHTNHADLGAMSYKLFGQKAIRFEFTRESNCSAKQLENIYHAFNKVKNEQNYIVTTGESMQSLELKYLELLLIETRDPNKKSQLQKQISWLSKILTMIKTSGDAIIDEVHQLTVKKKLNYTLDNLTPISSLIIEHSIKLHKFVDKLLDVSLIDELITNPESPIKYIINSQITQQILFEYFTNQNLSSVILKAPDEIQDILAFYKTQLDLLPHTKKRHYKEHYGPSQTKKLAIQNALAIPYFASNKPNERSSFGNPLEIINYTIKGLLIDGLNEEIVKHAILEWQRQAQMEQQKYNCLDITPTVMRINRLLHGTGMTLETINLRTKLGREIFSHNFSKLAHNKNLLFVILAEYILPQIVTESSILKSDAYNHVSLYHTAQGLTGTPWNYTTYHQDLRYNLDSSIGIDGEIEAILQENCQSVAFVKFDSPEIFLQKLLTSHESQNTRAIIDINATFAGYSNLIVAQYLATILTTSNPSLKYVLYFNDEDILCAIKISSGFVYCLETSDPNEINQKLSCTPNEYFTYYDQSHTVGADIKQSPYAHAFVLVDGNVTFLESVG